MAYLNVSQVITELGLPALLVRDLAQSRRTAAAISAACLDPGERQHC
jgi:hypothetical protein